MRPVFVDASYFVALLSPRDQHATAAREIALGFVGRMVTTTAVLDELCNALSATRTRQRVSQFVARLRARPDVEIVHADQLMWNQAFDLYATRSDKDWSLTDCLSFVCMNERGISDAFSTDHHFQQAGFTILM